MKLHPRVTRTAVELVKRFEGLRRRAARLPDGSWTIGYGHTKSAREGAEVSPEDAEVLLYYDLSEVATKVEAWTFTPLNQNQFEALTAFAFNIGPENFRRSTVLKRVNEGQHLPAAAAMELWRKSELDGEGLVIDALVRRRAAEKAHYLTPPEGFRPSPSQVLKPAFDFSVIEAAAQCQLASRAAVVDAPMDGDEATATVEHPPATTSRIGEPDSAARDAADHVSQKLQGLFLDAEAPGTAASPVETAHASVLYAPEPELEPEPAEPVNDAGAFEAPLFGVAESTGFVSRGFQPPPSRFPRPADAAPPAPANEYAPEEPVAVEPTSDVSLFEQPLAPPAPVAVEAAMPVHVDHSPFGDIETIERPKISLFKDRTLLWAGVGLLGILLFVSAIVSMLRGQATLANLLIGFLGVVLITPAGIHFLFHWMAGATPLPPPAES